MRIYLVLIFSFTLIFSSCEKQKETITFEIINTLDIDRSFETVEIDIGTLHFKNSTSANAYEVIDLDTNKTLTTQTVDDDGDGSLDILLFQPEIKANSTKRFSVAIADSVEKKDSILPECFSRFVPERTDDYAWENNRVAFRTYGPTAQKMVEDSVKGGTLSSGIDAWLKRVEYPIINKWYEKYTSGKGTYHEDTGEGLDNFHVGVSRGVGGVAVKTDSTYAVSKNFIDYKTITSGPVRTSFILEYGRWDIEGTSITETKHISLDYGSNLSKYTITVVGVDMLSVGLTLHKKDGLTSTNANEGWASYWEPLDDSKIGLGIVAPKAAIVGFDEYKTDAKDKSNLYTHLKVNNQKVVYYAGFGWKKSGQFASQKEWNSYLSNFSKRIENPLKVTKL